MHSVHVYTVQDSGSYTNVAVKPVLRGHFWDKEKMVFQNRWPLKRGSIHMKFFMIGQEKGDLLIQVTA